jgi:predicted dehydrogenase
MNSKNLLKFGVIGYGYWGPNIVRNLNLIDRVKIAAICDKSQFALASAAKAYPNVKTTSNYRDIVSAKDIDVVVIVTPVLTHFTLAKEALLNGKHIFVEKPFTASVKQAEELIQIAQKKKLKIMVDHTYLFTASVRKIKNLIDSSSFGQLYYYDSTRVNLGLFQHDVNVVWDLAPHDLSIMDYVIKDKPSAVVVTGTKHFNGRHENIAYLSVYFQNNIIAHFNINWLSPVKIRKTLIAGEKKMLVWDDLEADEKIKVYDKGVKIKDKKGLYELLVEYRSGDVWVPRLDHTEALFLEFQAFVDCIIKDRVPLNDGYAGLRIVKILEASNKSLAGSGRLVKL